MSFPLGGHHLVRLPPLAKPGRVLTTAAASQPGYLGEDDGRQVCSGSGHDDSVVGEKIRFRPKRPPPRRKNDRRGLPQR